MRVARLLLLALPLTVTMSCAVAVDSTGKNAGADELRPSEGREKDSKKEGELSDRDEWFWSQRTYPAGTIPVEVHRAEVRRELMRDFASRTINAEAWMNLGPRPLRDIPYGDFGSRQHSSGRLLTVAVSPRDENVILVGAAQGGIWKSSDRGVTFRPVGEESLPTLAVNIIRFDESRPDVIYAGTGEAHGSSSLHGSGLVRSTDGGETWTLLPDHGDLWDFRYAAITGLVIDARNANVLYVSTATIATRVARPSQPASGVFKSQDGGQTWAPLFAARRYTLPSGPAPSVGVMDLEYGAPTQPDLLYASEFYGGIHKSTDGGSSWRKITPAKSSGLGTFPVTVGALDVLDSTNGVYLRFDRIANADNASEFRRIELGVSPANPNVIYAGYDAMTNRLDTNRNGRFDTGEPVIPMGLLFRSRDGGATWSWLGSWRDGTPNYCATQCYFDNIVAVNPRDANDVIIAGNANYESLAPVPVNFPTRVEELPWRGMVYRTLDGGENWIDLTPHCTRVGTQPVGFTNQNLPVHRCEEFDAAKAIHPDSHNAAFAGDGSIYVSNDGGLYRAQATGDAAQQASYTWSNLNDSLSTLQFYRIDTHPTNPDIIVGGMQDNACGYFNGQTWEGWGAGDGTVTMFDPLEPDYLYIGSQFSIHRHDGGGVKDLFDGSWKLSVFSGQKIRRPEVVSFVPVMAIDPVTPNVIYATSDRALYRSDDRGASWARINDGDTDGVATTIAVSAADHNLVWVGTSTGSIYLYDFNPPQRRRGVRVPRATSTYPVRETTVTLIEAGLPDRFVSEIAADARDPNLVYVLYNGYVANTPDQPGRVFRSSDRGASWTNISANLPDVPASALALDPASSQRIWIGTDMAVYTTTDGGATWTSDRENMPVVTVLDLNYNPRTGFLTAGTHGRGVWRRRVEQTGGQ